LDTEHFEDSYIGRRAAKWLGEVSEEFPWYMVVSFVGPHDPYDPPGEYAEKYRGAIVPDPISDSAQGKPQWIRNKRRELDKEEVRRTRRQYCAAIELIDTQIGTILDTLEARGLLESTYIIFGSDHGDMLGDQGLYQKSVAYEAAVRVPLIAAGPGLQKGKTTGAMVELIDINPTICELAGLAGQENIDARSFCAVLYEQENNSHRDNAVTRMPNFQCIRTQKYKFISNMNDTDELYDLENDPMELNNIYHEEKDTANSLSKLLGQRYTEGEWLR
jgi:choline-sulfatase